MSETIFVIGLYISIPISFIFGLIGDLFSCKSCHLEGWLPSDENHLGICLAILFSWNIGILFCWIFPIYAFLEIAHYFYLRRIN